MPFHEIYASTKPILSIDWHPKYREILASGGAQNNIKIWNIFERADFPVEKIYTP
jgi:WD40 repeat protein